MKRKHVIFGEKLSNGHNNHSKFVIMSSLNVEFVIARMAQHLILISHCKFSFPKWVHWIAMQTDFHFVFTFFEDCKFIKVCTGSKIEQGRCSSDEIMNCIPSFQKDVNFLMWTFGNEWKKNKNSKPICIARIDLFSRISHLSPSVMNTQSCYLIAKLIWFILVDIDKKCIKK